MQSCHTTIIVIIYMIMLLLLLILLRVAVQRAEGGSASGSITATITQWQGRRRWCGRYGWFWERTSIIVVIHWQGIVRIVVQIITSIQVLRILLRILKGIVVIEVILRQPDMTICGIVFGCSVIETIRCYGLGVNMILGQRAFLLLRRPAIFSVTRQGSNIWILAISHLTHILLWLIVVRVTGIVGHKGYLIDLCDKGVLIIG